MPGPMPKPPGLRQRRNKVSTRSVLPSEEQASKNKVPPLYKRERETEKWHPMVIAWWQSIWKSPMAAEYLDADMRGGLYLLAELQQQRWSTVDPKVLAALAAEIRQQEVRFGLSPIDRRRLQWEVERGEQAEERIAKRRKAKDIDKQREGKDPRELLKVAK